MKKQNTSETLAEMQYAASMFSIYHDQLVAMATYFIGFLKQDEKLEITRLLNAAKTVQKGFVERIYDRSEDYSREEIAAVFTNLAKLVKANDTVKLNAIRGMIESECRTNENGDLEFYDPNEKQSPLDFRKTLFAKIQTWFWLNKRSFGAIPEYGRFDFWAGNAQYEIGIFVGIKTNLDYIIEVVDRAKAKPKKFTNIEKCLAYLTKLIAKPVLK